MASLKQLREIFAPILADYPDLVLRGRWLFRPPITAAIVGLYIGRTAYVSDSRMDLSVIPLSRFNNLSSLGFDEPFEVEHVIGAPAPNRGGRVEAEAPPRIFQDMFAPEYQAHLVRNFKAKVPPFLDSVRCFDGVASWVGSMRGSTYRHAPVELVDGWLSAMRGEFATAVGHLQAYIELIGSLQLSNGAHEQRCIEAIRDVLRTGDRAHIAAFLHEMEERTISQNRLQRFWRRTPFPFEKA